MCLISCFSYLSSLSLFFWFLMEWITALSVSLLILSSTSSSLLFELLSTGLFSIVTVFVSSVTFVWYFFVYSLLKFPVHAFFSWDGDCFYDHTLNSSSCQSLFSVSLRSVCGVFSFQTYFSVSSLSLTPCVVVFPLDPSSWGYANICQCPRGGVLSTRNRLIGGWILRQQLSKYAKTPLSGKDWGMGTSVCSLCGEFWGERHLRTICLLWF